MKHSRHLVCSMGGVGTTVLLEYLASRIDVNEAHGAYNPMKHYLRPPDWPELHRAIFVHGDPAAALASLFRRGLDAAHYRNIHGLAPHPDPLIDEDPWSAIVRTFQLSEKRPGIWIDPNGRYASDIGALDALEARKATRAQAMADRDQRTRIEAGYRDLNDILDRNLDPFSWKTQLSAWKAGNPSYPVLVVRYETLWNRWPEVRAFLELPKAPFVPWRPRIGWSSLTASQRYRLETWAASIRELTTGWPDIFRAS